MSATAMPPAPVQRQVALPLSKAVEIAYKSIRLRLSRSLLVTSGIILALAFLVSIQSSDAVINGMRSWITTHNQTVDAQKLEAKMKSNGVPTTPDQIASNRIQTRWLLGVGLLVGFVGILNSMLMSVTERFRESGTMKCLGALDGFIVKLFLIESLFQGVVGTAIGIVLGFAASMLMALATYGHFGFVNVPWHDVGLAVVYSSVVGVLLTVAG